MQDSEHRLLSHWHFQGEICKFKKISDLKEGASFGELGIIYNKPRIALIVSRSKCRLAILKKLEYLKIFCETENFERKQKREFVFGHFFAKFRELKY
jgi:CRP-like cAMP-binding protein